MVGQGWTLVAIRGGWRGYHRLRRSPFGELSRRRTLMSPPPAVPLWERLIRGYHYEYAWWRWRLWLFEQRWRSGGGCSAQFAAPGYQSSPSCGVNSRSLPDIALNADWINAPQSIVLPGDHSVTVGPVLSPRRSPAFYAQENAYLLYVQSLVGDTCGCFAVCAVRAPGQCQLRSSITRGCTHQSRPLSLL